VSLETERPNPPKAAAELVARATGFACLCRDGEIVLLNDAAMTLLDSRTASPEPFTGRHFISLVHEGDVWALKSWWGNMEDPSAPDLGARCHARIGSSNGGWRNLELTRASYWSGNQHYQIIFGRTVAGSDLYDPYTGIGDVSSPRAASSLKATLLRRERSKRKWAERSIRRLAYQDQLTGMINRAYFQQRLSSNLRLARDLGWGLMLLIIDIDHFKNINERLGYETGDRILKQIAERIKNCIRGTDMAARIGADEFAVVVSNADAPKVTDTLAQKLMTVLNAPYSVGDKLVNITCCIGSALYPSHSQDAEGLRKNAEIALSKAKQCGQGAYRIFDPVFTEQLQLRRQLEDELAMAISQGQLRVHYQPQIVMETGAIAGAEALVRWQHPERGMIPPAMFVPLAESSGLILPMTQWVMQTACTDLKRCLDLGIGMDRVSVNLSANLLAHSGLNNMISQILQKTGLPAKRLEVEITESMVMDDLEKASETLNSLYLLGVGIALDDFGTGYSSLTYLRQFPLGTLKIDRSFISEVSVNSEDIAIVRAVIALAHSLNLRVVAEGVEEEKQMEILKREHCDMVQGYYHSKPLPLNELIDWCMARKDVASALPSLERRSRSAG